MDRAKSVVTPARFQSGMTFSQYLTHVGTPENLKREGTGGSQRPDNSAVMREWYEGSRLTEAQTAAWEWLASQPGGPAKILVLSEDWSSDCRRDVPMLARVVEVSGMELRISRRRSRPRSERGRSSPPSRRRRSSGYGRARGSTRWQAHYTNAWSWGACDA